LEAPTALAAAAGVFLTTSRCCRPNNSGMVSLASYALLEPATGLVHRRFGRRPVVVMPLRALRSASNLSQVSSVGHYSLSPAHPSVLSNVYLAMVFYSYVLHTYSQGLVPWVLKR
jgi:hypothetical protein